MLVAQLRGVSFEPAPMVDLKGFGPKRLVSRVPSGGRILLQAWRLNKKQRLAPLSQMENPYEFATTANEKTFKGRTSEMEELIDSIQHSAPTLPSSASREWEKHR